MLRYEPNSHNGKINFLHNSLSILKDCYSKVQLASGASFQLDLLQDVMLDQNDKLFTVQSGGSDVIPRMIWSLKNTNKSQIEITLKIRNTTKQNMYLDRVDVLVSDSGYMQLPVDDIRFRRTGWQSFGTAAVQAKFEDYDPWLQPPLHMPKLPPTTALEQNLPWVTIISSNEHRPLLIGFASAFNYTGMINIQAGASNTNRICVSNYLENLELSPGQEIESERLILATGDEAETMLSNYGEVVGKIMQARVPERVPTGWSSWFYYFTDVTEQAVLENARQIIDKKLPLEYVEIDDGYQTEFGDWTSINSSKFPNGMRYVADEIKKLGLKPGVWLTPFMANANSQIFREHPDWFLKDERGNHINVNRHGDVYWREPNYGLDTTHPEAVSWLENVINTICHEWGYEYIKIDYLYAGAIQANRFDATCTSVQAYRKGLEIIRNIAGDRLILGCGAPLLSSVGFVDSMRISSDLLWSKRPKDPTLPLGRDPIASLFSHMWMNKLLWINDPDYMHVRQHKDAVPWQQALTLTTLIAMSGGALHNSDNLSTLEPKSLELLRRVYPPIDIKARPVTNGKPRPDQLIAKAVLDGVDVSILANFNWSDQPKKFTFDPEGLSIKNTLYKKFDLLTYRPEDVIRAGSLIDKVPPLGVGLYLLWEDRMSLSKQKISEHIFGL